MVMALLRRGWGHSDILENAWTPAGAQLFNAELSPPANYWCCLLSHEALLKKGVPEVKHGAPDAYYQCLLRCTAEQTAELIRDGIVTNLCFCAL